MESGVGSNSTALDQITYNEAAPSTDSGAEKLEVQDYEREWTVRSMMQVLGGFMLLFNSYRSPISQWQLSDVGEDGVI